MSVDLLDPPAVAHAMTAKRGRPSIPEDQKIKRAAAMLRKELVDALVEVAESESKSVAELVDESPLIVWIKEKRLHILKKKLDETAELRRQIAAIKSDLEKK